MERKQKTLLEKYEMPLNHLDFGYIENCADAREMEKIVQILRSGEEGYFPELMQCAEDKLRALKPQSKLFRLEEHIRGREFLPANEWKPIYEWTRDIKTKDNKLAELRTAAVAADNAEALELVLPPIRKGGSIKPHKLDAEAADKDSSGTAVAPYGKLAERCIKSSTDYRKWDQYDADVEVLRMDLAEERVKEEVERKNRRNLEKSTTLSPKITEIENEADKELSLLKKLTVLEREQLAEDYRLRGNEYFRTKEYENAIAEYSRAIQFCPETAAPAFNNRAVANLKLQKFAQALEDCEHCLKLEPNNLKARLRRAEATYGHGKRRESYDLYLKVLELDPTNAVALKATTELRTQLGDLPPAHATRLQIQEDKPTTSKNALSQHPTSNNKNTTTTTDLVPAKSTAKTVMKETAPAKKTKEYDFADLVVPNRIVKNKLASAAAAFGNLAAAGAGKQKSQEPTKQSTSDSVNIRHAQSMETQLRLPLMNAPPKPSSMGKMLIEEI